MVGIVELHKCCQPGAIWRDSHDVERIIISPEIDVPAVFRPLRDITGSSSAGLYRKNSFFLTGFEIMQDEVTSEVAVDDAL